MGKETELHSVILPASSKRYGRRGAGVSNVPGPIRHAALPSTAVIPLIQHAGVPAKCIVNVGQAVREGMLIATADGPLSSAVHSPIPGVVAAIRRILLPSGKETPAIFIRLEGEFDRLGKSPSRTPIVQWPEDEGLAYLDSMGVLDIGRSDLPLSLAWRTSRGTKVEHFIVSALPRDAYQSAEELLVAERPREIASGIAAACRILHPKSVSLVLIRPEGSDGAPLGEELVRAAGAMGIVMELRQLPWGYPAPDERRLAREIAGRLIPDGESVSDAGVIVTTPSTLLAAANAFDRQIPMIERTVVVAGGAVREPAALRVRIGTRIGDLFEECGGLECPPERIVMGAAMTGEAVWDLSLPVMKTTEGLLALTSRETKGGRRAPCIACGSCTSVCPEGLLPAQLFKLVEHGNLDDARDLGLSGCTDCGLCSYVCPSHIPLAHGLRTGKGKLRRETERNPS